MPIQLAQFTRFVSPTPDVLSNSRDVRASLLYPQKLHLDGLVGRTYKFLLVHRTKVGDASPSEESHDRTAAWIDHAKLRAAGFKAESQYYIRDTMASGISTPRTATTRVRIA